MMRRYLPFISCVLLSLPAPMMAMAAGDAEAGKAIYLKTCKACHGVTGQGNPAMIKSSKGALEDITTKAVQGRSDQQLAKDIAGGTPTKKAIKALTPKEMADVIAYVRTLAQK